MDVSGSAPALLSKGWLAQAVATRKRKRATFDSDAQAVEPAAQETKKPRRSEYPPPDLTPVSLFKNPARGRDPGMPFLPFGLQPGVCAVLHGDAYLPLPPRRTFTGGKTPRVVHLGAFGDETSLASRVQRLADGAFVPEEESGGEGEPFLRVPPGLGVCLAETAWESMDTPPEPRWEDLRTEGTAIPKERLGFKGTLHGPKDAPYKADQVAITGAVLARLRAHGRATFESPVGTGKTVMLCHIVNALGRRALVACTQSNLLGQAATKGFARHTPGLRVGRLVGRNYKAVEGMDVVLCTLRTLADAAHDPAFMATFGTFAVDEVHGAVTPEALLASSLVPARYRFGFSGTLRRNDDKGLAIPALFGDIAVRQAKEWPGFDLHAHFVRYTSIFPDDGGRIVPEAQRWGKNRGRVDMHDFNAFLSGERTRSEAYKRKRKVEWLDARGRLHLAVATVRARLVVKQIAADLAAMPRRAKIMVFSSFVQHLRLMARVLKEDHGVDSGLLWQKTTSADRIGAELAHRVVFTTYGSGSAGVDDPDIDTIYLTSPLSKSTNIGAEQRFGRVRDGEGKNAMLVRDFIDHCDQLYGMWNTRLGFMQRFKPTLVKHNHAL